MQDLILSGGIMNLGKAPNLGNVGADNLAGRCIGVREGSNHYYHSIHTTSEYEFFVFCVIVSKASPNWKACYM